MPRHFRLCAISVVLALAAPMAATADDNVQRYCSMKTRATYGFQCQGFANVGAGFEPVTFLGTVSGSSSGIFEGTGTLNSSIGALHVHAVGQATFADRTCAGHIQYQQNIVEGPPLPPLDIDFVTVDGGFEILGAPTAAPPAAGDQVPRMSCRLVQTR